MAKRRETPKHTEAFEAWYQLGRNFTKVSKHLTVSRPTLYSWADWFDWQERADGRDKKAKQLADEEAAKERAERQKRRRRAAELLTARGVKYFAENEIDTPRDAIQAIKAGLENERKEDGVPDWALMILNAKPEDLAAMGSLFGLSLPDSEATGGDTDSVSSELDAEVEE